MNELEKYLKELASESIPEDSDDFVPDDVAGGNIDDAYYAGSSAGKVWLARFILETYFKK